MFEDVWFSVCKFPTSPIFTIFATASQQLHRNSATILRPSPTSRPVFGFRICPCLKRWLTVFPQASVCSTAVEPPKKRAGHAMAVTKRSWDPDGVVCLLAQSRMEIERIGIPRIEGWRISGSQMMSEGSKISNSLHLRLKTYLGSIKVLSSFETWSGERSAELVSNCETRNPKPETRNRLWRLITSPGPIETRNPKLECGSSKNHRKKSTEMPRYLVVSVLGYLRMMLYHKAVAIDITSPRKPLDSAGFSCLSLSSVRDVARCVQVLSHFHALHGRHTWHLASRIPSGFTGGFHQPTDPPSSAEQPNPVLAAFSNCTVFKPRHGCVPMLREQKFDGENVVHHFFKGA